ncbi:MAG: hypothetical protein ACFB0G_11300 [Leptolyngbyaceae cyanobacterium]
MIKSLANGINSIILACVALTVLSLGLIVVQLDPVWLLLRNVLLTALGEPTPGITIQGDNRAPVVNCDHETGVCDVEK